MSSRPPLTDEDPAGLKRWLETWRWVGPVLEAERWERLAAMSEEEANQAARDVLDLWQPDWSGDQGEALRLHQQVFARTRPAPPQ